MSKGPSAHLSTYFGALLTFIFFAAVAATPAQAASSGLRSAKVYGGGGNTNAQFTNDVIEIFNRSAAPISLNGMSLQYTSASCTGSLGASGLLTVLPNVTLQQGNTFLRPRLAVGTQFGFNWETPNSASAACYSIMVGAG